MPARIHSSRDDLRCRFLSALLIAPLLSCLALQPCRIQVVEETSGWPVPLVQLSTTHHQKFVTDNAGNIAFGLPELMGEPTWFDIEGHGYVVKKDGFGMHGVRLTPTPGGHLTVKVKRQLPGRRLGRLTGAGLFAESQKLGLHQDWKEQHIPGCDSVQIAVHNKRIFWAWGDTTLARYPLGMFHMSSATTSLRPIKRFEPPIQLPFDYFQNEKGRPRVVAEMPGSGPTWVSGYTSLPDQEGNHHLVGTYIKVRPPLTAYEAGLCVWNEDTENFERLKVIWEKSDNTPEPPLLPDGHPALWTNNEGKKWLLFGDPFPRFKCPPTFEAWKDPNRWIPLEPQEKVPTKDGKSITPHRGSIAWSAFRGKWVSVFTQLYGDSSHLGEIWYVEADQPTGPWGPAIKVVTHNDYTFYNPRIHPELTDPESPILLFEGTYTQQFAKDPDVTPRYDYNQILYRIDLDTLSE